MKESKQKKANIFNDINYLHLWGYAIARPFSEQD